jgi:tellurite resistance protein
MAQLQSQLKETERSISREIDQDLEQARCNDIQEIKKLKASLDEAKLKIQVSQAQVL